MNICYYAVQPIVIGDEVRQQGDLIPEATIWPQHIQNSYVNANRIAPVLTATLPKSKRDEMAEWEKDYLRLQEMIEVETPVSELDEEARLEKSIEAELESGNVDFDLEALDGMDAD